MPVAWYDRKTYDPDNNPPYCIQVEPTEGCNLRCDFCGLNGIRGPLSEGMNLKFMTVATAEEIGKQIASKGWTPRFEFAMHGEPTLNRDLAKIISVIDDHTPKSYKLIETNGAGLVGDPVNRILDLFRAGINTVALDEYQNVNLVPRIKAAMWSDGQATGAKEINDNGISIYLYPQDHRGNPHQRDMTQRRLVFIQPIDLATKGTHATISNHSGLGAPKDHKRNGKRCAKTFRELSVRWNGDVSICCSDWRGIVKAGNIHEIPIAEIWSGDVFGAARRKLIKGQRDFGPCDGCDYISYRAGLLPDKKGQEWIDDPSEWDEEVLRKAMEGDPYTTPVLRPWELVNIK